MNWGLWTLTLEFGFWNLEFGIDNCELMAVDYALGDVEF
jgi:hypothetical protein